MTTTTFLCSLSALLLAATTVSAQPAPAPSAPRFDRFWVDVNIGVAIPTTASSTTATRTIFREPATFKTDYATNTGADFDFGFGVMLTSRSGVGFSSQGAAHEGFPTLAVRIPHPVFPNTYASATAVGDTALTRTEGTIHIHGMFVVTPPASRTRVRLFFGPSYFRVHQQTIDDIRYLQTFVLLQPVNTVNITTYNFSDSEGTGWGFHGGVDVSVFFNRVVGVGGIVRFSRGTVNLVDASGTFPSKTGGVSAGGGLRLKF